jgi:hypothetical protein
MVRQSVRPATSGTTWSALGLAFVAVVAVGVVGYTRYQQSLGALQPMGTRVYQSVQLFVLEGSMPGTVPWQLQVARFAAPAVAAFAIVQAVLTVFRDQLDALRLQRVHDHVVVAGLGRKGARLAHALLSREERVVVIDTDSDNPEIDTLRAAGALVVVGDARNRETQRRAGVERARCLAALCGADATNTEIAERARELSAGRRTGSLHCVAHLVDPELSVLLSAEELEVYGAAPVRVDFVNSYDAAARALVAAHPPTVVRGEPLPWVIVGAGATAEHVHLALARAWAAHAAADAQRLPLVLVGRDAPSLARSERRHPELRRFTDATTVASPPERVAGRTPATVCVCPDDDDAAAAAALELRHLLAGKPTEIVVVLEQRAGLGQLLERMPRPACGPAIAAFGQLDETFRPEVVLAGTTELLARALHEQYLAQHRAGTGVAASGDGALRPWEDLSESLRESNRDHAAHVATTLAAIGRTIGPLADWDAAHVPFSTREVETMARVEHDRWQAERARAGWRPGSRDVVRRTTPYLVPWDDLPDDVREVDRAFVSALPQLLASVGLQAVPRARDHEEVP